MFSIRTNLAIGQSSRSCTYTLLLPQGVELELIIPLWAAFSKLRARYELTFNIAKFGQETCTLPLIPEVVHTPSFNPKVSKFSLFSLYGQQSPRYGLIFKIAIHAFGQETWPWTNVPEVAHTICFHPRGSKLSVFLLYGQRFLTYRLCLKNCHIWAWNLAIGQSSRSCKYTPFLPQGV